MNYQKTTEKIKQLLKEQWQNESSGHDFHHLQRVVNNAKKLTEKEGGNKQLIELAAWLHDSFDDKVVENSEKEKEFWMNFLRGEQIPEKEIQFILDIIDDVSFRKNKDKTPKTIEAKIVQDADRLDAIGAIGIARTFAFGGSRNRPIYDDFKKPGSERQIPNSESTLAHFYEKLLLLKDLMNTDTAKEMAIKRHEFMQGYLEQFFNEIDSKE